MFNHLKVPESWNSYFSKYPNGLTVLEALVDWVGQVDSMVDHINTVDEHIDYLNKNLEEFYLTFQENLSQEIMKTLQAWIEDGTLGEVIAQLIEGRMVFQNIQALQAAPNVFKLGTVVELLGYHSAGDGAGHKRIIASVDDGSGVAVGGKWANIISNDGHTINIRHFGISGESGHEIVFQKAINFIDVSPKKYVLTVPVGNYFFNSTVNLPERTPIFIKGANMRQTTFLANAEIEAFFKKDGATFNLRGGGVSGVRFLGNDLAQNALLINKQNGFEIEKCYFSNFKYSAISLGAEQQTYETLIRDCYFRGDSSANGSGADYHIRLGGFATDNYIRQNVIVGSRLAAIRVDSGHNHISDNHFFEYPAGVGFPEISVHVTSPGVHILSNIFDTPSTGVKCESGVHTVQISDNIFFWNGFENVDYSNRCAIDVDFSVIGYTFKITDNMVRGAVNLPTGAVQVGYDIKMKGVVSANSIISGNVSTYTTQRFNEGFTVYNRNLAAIQLSGGKDKRSEVHFGNDSYSKEGLVHLSNTRWIMGKDDTAEGTESWSNVGADFLLKGYSNSGVPVEVMRAKRSGDIIFSKSFEIKDTLKVGTFSNGNEYIQLKKGAQQALLIENKPEGVLISGTNLTIGGGVEFSSTAKLYNKAAGYYPTLTSSDQGAMIWSSTLKKPIFWDGSKWVDATGVAV